MFQVPMDRLDALAQRRDVAALSAYLATHTGRNPFSVIKTGGGYSAGSMGWTAKLLTPKNSGRSFVVFSTPIIEEDMGELLFRVNANGKLVYVPETDNLGMLMDSHAFNVSFDLPKKEAKVVDTFTAHWERKPGQFFVFRFSPTFRVDSLTDPGGNPVPFAQAGGIVAVSPRSSETQFKVTYAGTVRKPGFSREISTNEATLSGAVWYPTIARRPATYDIEIHCQKHWSAIAQGNEVSSAVLGEERLTKFKLGVPVVWFSAGAGPYKTEVSTIRGREYAVMSAHMTPDQMRLQNEINSDVVDFYSSTFGRYPFKRWTFVDSDQFRQGVGALEGYSFATYPGSRPGEDDHEPSHTWWGGIVPNDYLKSIWNESFADFSQDFINRYRQIGNRDERSKSYASPIFYTDAYDAAPLADSGQEIGPPATALGYGKGAFVLQVLADEVGDNTMAKCLKDWVATNPSRHIASWEDFERSVDHTTRKDFKWFFDEWVRGVGFPEFALTEASWQDGKLSGKVVFEGTPYRIDPEVLLEFPDGRSVSTRVSLAASHEATFTIDSRMRPTKIALDPWVRIARRKVEDRRVTLGRVLGGMTQYLDPKTPGYLAPLRSNTAGSNLPTDLNGAFLIGSPDSVPKMKPLCEAVGFQVSGSTLTYKGTTIDLRRNGAMAVVDLPSGGQCVIGLGNCVLWPNLGNSRLMLFDRLGRAVRARTDPNDNGALARDVR